jgi:hypothetical protein
MNAKLIEMKAAIETKAARHVQRLTRDAAIFTGLPSSRLAGRR